MNDSDDNSVPENLLPDKAESPTLCKKCFGITKELKRCRNSRSGRFYCHKHRRQPIHFAVAAALAIFLNYVAALIPVPWKSDGQAELIRSIQERNPGTLNSPEELMAYREIVARIYGDLQADSKIRLRDTITSKSNIISHTFDLTIRATQAGQAVLTVVNVYPGVAPVDEEGVSTFAKSLEDVRAAKGVMVCNGGFTQSAKLLAPSLGIELASVQDARSRNWREDIKIPVLRIDRVVHLNFSLEVVLDAGAVVSKSLSGWQFTQDDGKTVFNIVGLFTNLWNNKLIPPPKAAPQQIALDDARLKVWIGNTSGSGIWTNATGLRFVYQCRETGGWLKYFSPTEYLAVKDQLSENIQVMRLNVQLGPFVPDTTWTRIKSPEAIMKRTKGVLVVVEPMLEQIGGGITDEFFDMRTIAHPTNSAPR